MPKSKTALNYPVFTYHEKQRLQEGSKSQRLGADSLLPFDACALTLQRARTPVCTPRGVVYDKEAILACLVEQKQDIRRRVGEWEARLQAAEADAATEAGRKEAERVRLFEARERGSVVSPTAAGDKGGEAGKESMFWLPGAVAEAKAEVGAKPSSKTVCPADGKPLRAKDLIELHFARSKTNSEQFECPISSTTLSNKDKLAVIKPTGAVVLATCIPMILKDKADPISGKAVGEGDIMYLRPAGSGYAGSGAEIVAKRAGLVARLS